MADESHAAAGGLFDSLKTLSGSLVSLVQTRLELLSTDIAEERLHLTRLLVLGLLALFCFGVGVVLLAMLIVVIFWDTHRLAALGGLTGFFLAAGAGLVAFALHKARTRPRLFEASLAELSKDRQHLNAEP
ncbi:MAG: phage holin family protein [Thiobacillus sp.]|uniref:phage holin family protein n=1 Tax=Thiobacillus sp. TaxID=924 RepID=UPI0027355EB8|nr:phage holin family protein [Thiobacillus sp.]MDP3586218.1 phage holin family protein [Thiobacillus sp.]